MTTTIGATPSDPYSTRPLTSSGGVLVVDKLVTSLAPIVSGTTTINAETYNGGIPGPTFFLTVGDTVTVRLINNLPYPTGIHWHGIELSNSMDGTPFTQDGVRGGPGLPPAIPQGGTYLYQFTVTRPGLFWYHPHHYHSTNRVFRGLYGMIVVADPDETSLVGNTLPTATQTEQLVLSDITVCQAPGSNLTYVDPSTVVPASDAAEWLSNATSQPAPSPAALCEVANGAMTEDGSPAATDYLAGDVPNIQNAGAGRTNEGQIVLTNGVNVGARLGTPDSPQALATTGVYLRDVTRGQGLRLQLVNSSTVRFFRLRLTGQGGNKVNLVRVGGEGGLLDHAVLEGTATGGFDFKYDQGEILLPPASRADVVAAIPATEAVGSTLTLWTRDYERTGQGYSRIPTVPVMHLRVTAAPAISPAYSIVGGPGGVDGPTVTKLRAKAGFPGPLVPTLPPPGAATLLDPTTFSPAKVGLPSSNIRLTAVPNVTLGIDDIPGATAVTGYYANAAKIGSARYGKLGDVLELQVSNMTSASHPFHLHGFSFQPKRLEVWTGTVGVGAPASTYDWPYQEFRDNINVPRNSRLTFRVRLQERVLCDGTTVGGALGRWLFHCHIFFHAHGGMISELVVTDAAGKEKPNVDVGGSWAYTNLGGTATRRGTFSHPDGDVVTLAASFGNLTYPAGVSSGEWEWERDTSALPDPAGTQYVYITATDTAGRQDQTVFRLQIGGTDLGSDLGDPHIRTVDGTRYDFQAAGEFTLLRDYDGMELQTRQTPVATAPPITDPYSGLKSCVTVNTAFAARVGAHRIALQPGRERRRLELYVDGKRTELTSKGIDLGSHRVSGFEVGGELGLRIDYAHQAVVTVSPRWWASHGVWLLDVSVSNTHADEGIMGAIADGSWLPALPSGATLGPKPASLHDRYLELYRTFANAWRVTDQTSLFVYEPGTSTATFTDVRWPAEKPPCKLRPGLGIPGPIAANIEVEKAAEICKLVTDGDLHRSCVFDVATTGDETFADGYLEAQDLRRRGTWVQVVGEGGRTPLGTPVVVRAIVLPITCGRPTPTGSVTFLVDGVAVSRHKLDRKGQARARLDELKVGEHTIRAVYEPGRGRAGYHTSSSPNLLHTVVRGRPSLASTSPTHRVP